LERSQPVNSHRTSQTSLELSVRSLPLPGKSFPRLVNFSAGTAVSIRRLIDSLKDVLASSRSTLDVSRRLSRTRWERPSCSRTSSSSVYTCPPHFPVLVPGGSRELWRFGGLCVRQGGQEGRQAAPEYVQVFRVAQVAARGSRGVVKGQERAGKPENETLEGSLLSPLALSLRGPPPPGQHSDVVYYRLDHLTRLRFALRAFLSPRKLVLPLVRFPLLLLLPVPTSMRHAVYPLRLPPRHPLSHKVDLSRPLRPSLLALPPTRFGRDRSLLVRPTSFPSTKTASGVRQIASVWTEEGIRGEKERAEQSQGWTKMKRSFRRTLQKRGAMDTRRTIWCRTQRTRKR
jgi:hypothetical protein